MTTIKKKVNLGWVFFCLGIFIPLIAIIGGSIWSGVAQNFAHNGAILISMFIAIIIVPSISFLCGIIFPFIFTPAEVKTEAIDIVPLSANLIGLLIIFFLFVLFS